ncbi:hypothetical protein Ancab_004535, partial [Ancistrocladus abbreviatus]
MDLHGQSRRLQDGSLSISFRNRGMVTGNIKLNAAMTTAIQKQLHFFRNALCLLQMVDEIPSCWVLTL